MKSLEKGIFILSLDFELAWGMRGDPAYKADFERTREVIDRMLALFEKYEIKATWATVGELFLKGEAGSPDNQLWHAPEVIEKIKKCRVPQEIGSHSFSHKVVGEDCTREEFEEELKRAVEVAKQNGVELKSYVYPKNSVGFTDLLSKYGFTSYRGVDQNWYRNLPRLLKKLAHAFDNYFAMSAPVVSLERDGEIWNIPGSYFFPHARGWAKWLPGSFRVRKSVCGLKKATREKKIFHLWFHPFNLASNPTLLLPALEEVLKKVSEMRSRGEVENLTMGEAAERGIPPQAFDYLVALKPEEEMLASFRKTLRHILNYQEARPPLGGMASQIYVTANENETRATYKIYLRTMREAMNLCLPWQVFKDAGEVFVYKNGETVLGFAMFQKLDKTVRYHLAGTTREGKKINVAHKLLWHAMCYYQDLGFKEMWLGPTGAESSLVDFKRGWRGIEHPIYPVGDQVANKFLRRSKFRKLWRFIQISLTPLASKIVGRFVL